MQQRLHVLDGGEKREGRHRRPVAVERKHVLAPGRAVPEDEHLAPSLGAQIEQFVSGAAQEAGEIEVSGLEPVLPRRCAVFRLSTLHFTVSSKKGPDFLPDKSRWSGTIR